MILYRNELVLTSVTQGQLLYRLYIQYAEFNAVIFELYDGDVNLYGFYRTGRKSILGECLWGKFNEGEKRLISPREEKIP